MNNDSRLFNEKYNLKINETSFNKIDINDNQVAKSTNKKPSRNLSAIKSFFKNPIAVISLLIFVGIFIYSYIGVLLSDFKPNEIIAPSQQNGLNQFFGVDVYGYDVLTRTLKATTRTLELALLVATVSMIFGTVLGVLAGLKTSAADTILSKAISLYNLVPVFIWYSILMLVMPKNYWSMFGVLALTSWQKFFSISRKQVQAQINQKHIFASEMIGLSKTKIFFKHIWPYVYGQIIGQFIVSVSNVIIAEVSLKLMFSNLVNDGLTLGGIISEASSVAGLALSKYVLLPTTIVLLISLSMYLTSFFVVRSFEVRNKGGVINE